MTPYSIPANQFDPITDKDYDYIYHDTGRGSPGTVYKITHKIDKGTGNKVPSMLFHKSERDMSKEEIDDIKNNWIKTDTIRWEDIDPYTHFKAMVVKVRNKQGLPLNLQGRVFTTYLDPKISKKIKPKTKEIFGEILDNL